MSFAAFRSQTTEEQHTADPAWSGMRALMLAVLEDGINNLSSPDGRLRTEAEIWITRRESRYVFSFEVICETLDLNPFAVRHSVVRIKDTKHTHGRLVSRSRPNVRRRGLMTVPRPLSARRSSYALNGRARCADDPCAIGENA